MPTYVVRPTDPGCHQLEQMPAKGRHVSAGADAAEGGPRRGRTGLACGIANLFMLSEPLAGKRHVKVAERRTAADFAHVIRDLRDLHYPGAETVAPVMDNLNTHPPASLYQAFAPEEARRLAGRNAG